MFINIVLKNITILINVRNNFQSLSMWYKRVRHSYETLAFSNIHAFDKRIMIIMKFLPFLFDDGKGDGEWYRHVCEEGRLTGLENRRCIEA